MILDIIPEAVAYHVRKYEDLAWTVATQVHRPCYTTC